MWQAMKMAAVAEGHEVNVAPHNFYGHLCTMMNAHFSAAVPNLRIMETDIDRLPWDDDLVTHPPVYEDGHLIVPDRPGWGSDPIGESLRAHPPRSGGGIAGPPLGADELLEPGREPSDRALVAGRGPDEIPTRRGVMNLGSDRHQQLLVE